MRRLVLVRHGESIWNAEARIQGQQCAGLSATGHTQAKLVAQALGEAYPSARLVTSDLQRTVETAAPLAAQLGRAATPLRGLRERTFGAWEGRLRADVREQDRDRWARWVAGEDVVEEIGGESAAALADRVEPVLRELLQTTPSYGVTIAITHGGPVWHGTHRLLGLPPGTLGGVGNASVTELVAWSDRLRGDGREQLVLDRWNELAHLPVELRTGWLPKVSSDAPPVGR